MQVLPMRTPQSVIDICLHWVHVTICLTILKITGDT